MYSPKDKVWFVTGASSGMGKAMTVYLLEQGNKVVATLRKPKDVADLALKYPAEQLLVVKLDLVSTNDIQNVFKQAVEKFGRIDVVYSNAGYADVAEFESTTEEGGRRLFDVNFWGSVNVANESLRVFRDVNKPQGGRFLQVSSMAGMVPMPVLALYTASKHALEGAMGTLAAELDPSWSIKINTLQLGEFRTTDRYDRFAPRHPAYTTEDLSGNRARKHFGEGHADAEGSDPAKASREIYKIAIDDSVGLRVPIGKDAIKIISDHLEAVKKDVQASEKWSVDVAFD